MQLVVRITWRESSVAAAVTGAIAAFAATVLLQLPVVWLALVAVGLLVFCGSLVARDAKIYWLSVFISAVPLNITKLFFWEPDDVALIKRQFAIYINENLVPQMYLADLPLAMLIAIWAGEILQRRRRIEVPRAVVLMAAFLVWALFTVVTARLPLLGAAWLIYEVKLLVLFLWFVNARLSRADLRHVVAVLLVALAVQSGITFYTYVTQSGEDVFGSLFGAARSAQEVRVGPSRGSGAAFVFEQGALLRGTGTIGTANLEAKYFVLLLPLALVAAVTAGSAAFRAAAAAIVTMGAAALYLTYSRGGLLCAALGLLLVPCFLTRAGWWDRRRLVATLAAGAALVAVASPFLLAYLSSRPGFSMTRITQAWYGIEIFLRHPVAGVGLNNFNLAVSPLAYDGTFAGSPIHNHYLRIAIETGLVGAVLYFGFFMWAVRLAYRLTRAADPFVAATASGLCAALIGIAVYWLEDLFYDPIIRMQTWILIGMIAALARIAGPDASRPLLPMLGPPAARVEG